MRRVRLAVAGVITGVLALTTAPGIAAEPTAVAAASPSVHRDDQGTAAARAALERLAPKIAHRFVLRREDPTAVGGSFTISAAGNRIVLSGSDDVAILTAFDRYLGDVADGQLSRAGDHVPSSTPLPSEPIHKETRYSIRDSNNFTVAGYTYPNWSWAQWEREIDLLAASGVNHALVTIGQEAVWYDTWQEFGYSSQEAAAWISLPAHQPWQFMSNLHSFGGGMSPDLIERRAKLGRQIIDRMRELGITPVLPGFAGSVPDGFAQRNPGAEVVPQGLWEGYDRPGWLDTTTDLYQEVSAEFYASQRERFGQVPDQAIDLLHEGGQSGGVDLTDAAAGIVEALGKHDPDFTWVIQAWGGNPRQDVIAGTDLDHVLVLDLTGGAWSGKKAFWGAPWAWGSLPNYGERDGLYGNLPRIASQVPTLPGRSDAGALVGTTFMSEGLDTTPIVWDLMTEAVWESSAIDLDAWVASYVTARYGRADADAIAAWQTLVDVAFGRDTGADSLFNAAPSLTATRSAPNAPTSLGYDPVALQPALVSLLRAAPRLLNRATFRYDLVDVARQVLVNEGRVLLPKIHAAYAAKDVADFEELTAHWLELMDLEDELLATHEEFMLGPWLAEARAWGADEQEADALEYDSRSLFSSWVCRPGGPKHYDYANRDWSGLVGAFYKPRWAAYFDGLAKHLRGGPTPEPVDYCQQGEAWAREQTTFPTKAKGNLWKLAREVAHEVYAEPRVGLGAAATATAGQPFDVSLDVRNADTFMVAPTAGLEVPDGWKAEPLDTLDRVLRPYSEHTARWRVTPPSDARPSTNLALGRPARQSSEYDGGQYPAGLAADGNTANFSTTDYESQPWWEVDLGASSPVAQVKVWNRSSCCQARVAAFHVLVSETPITATRLDEALADPAVSSTYFAGIAGRPSTIDVNGQGRYVRVWTTIKDTPETREALNIAEVEVLDRPAFPITATLGYVSQGKRHQVTRSTSVEVVPAG